jgi:hypothetical protein
LAYGLGNLVGLELGLLLGLISLFLDEVGCPSILYPSFIFFKVAIAS